MRFLIISNRLPITAEKKEDKIIFKESSGGLVSGLSSYLDYLKNSTPPSETEFVWLGWPGVEIDPKEQDTLRDRLFSDYNAYPVFLSKELMTKFYQGFCNNTIWPLFHYFPSYTEYAQDKWEYYNEVNEKFLDAVLEIAQPDDIIWVHDYHLMLLPKLIREKRPDARIGFFLHIPFPAYEMFSLLPSSWRLKIIEGLLGADLIGFHTYDYTQSFIRTVLRVLGLEADMGNITFDNRIIKVDTFPMGIDYKKFNSSLDLPEVQENIKKLKKTINYEKVVLSIDRLDYTKGIINRLDAYETFLKNNPEWVGRIVLLLVVIPSRIGVEHYRKMRKHIDETVGRINGTYGSINWSPISYKYGFLPFKSLVAFYSISDIIMVTPLRDGMNLISKEYVACRKDKTGVVILSEMAGSSKELGEALIINPNNKNEIASAIKSAIDMPVEEQIRRTEVMQSRLKRYDVVKWADDFIQKVIYKEKNHETLKSKLLNDEKFDEMLSKFRNSKKSLIFLDYDGTLVPFADKPEQAKPGEFLLNLLSDLTKNEKLDFVVISGRDRNTLQSWLGKLNIEIIAEHGAWLREKNKNWELIRPMVDFWKPQIISILEMYVDRLPGSFIEEKEFSVSWHYRKADPELSALRTRELIDHLLSYTANINVQLLQGNKVVEIRNAGINKGIAGLKWISKNTYDFTLAIGDDWTDEDLFKVLPDSAYSIKVGLAPSHSKYYLPNHKDVINLLERLQD
ncbi:MAG: bifunctional alpha,alpha-trehalose-phosphate synthase (UDP-forming)/trehalose-phosphatase [Ignavibacteriaceae bacterium]